MKITIVVADKEVARIINEGYRNEGRTDLIAAKDINENDIGMFLLPAIDGAKIKLTQKGNK